MDREQYEANQRLRQEGLIARDRNRAWRRQGGGQGGHAGRGPLVGSRPARTPEHFHISYHVPADNIVIPYYPEIYVTAREAYVRVHAMGQEAEPQTEWYENGLVGIETSLNGRSGHWWIVLEVTRCVRSGCRPYLPKDLKKRQMVVVRDATSEMPALTAGAPVPVEGA